MSTEINTQVASAANAVETAVKRDAQIVYQTVQGVHPVWTLVLAVLIVVGGFYINHYLVGFQKALDAANQKAQIADQTAQAAAVYRQQAEAQIAADKSAITALASQQVKVIQVQAATDKQAAQTVQQVKQDATAPAVAADSTKYLGVTPTATPDGLLAYQPPDVKGFVVTKIEHDQFKADLGDETLLYQTEQQKTTKLADALSQSQGETAKETRVAQAWQASSDAYKSVAVKSKGKKFLDGLKRVGEDALIAGAAYELGKHN